MKRLFKPVKLYISVDTDHPHITLRHFSEDKPSGRAFCVQGAKAEDLRGKAIDWEKVSSNDTRTLITGGVVSMALDKFKALLR